MTICTKSFLMLVCVFLVSCKSDGPKIRPSSVPLSAVWAGGPDGGGYIDCVPSQKGEANPCTVYNDGTGDTWMSGAFMLDSQRGASAAQLKYSGSDGEKIFLENNLVLSPVGTMTPGSIPKTSLLAENGVYVDCHSGAPDLYQCSLFLAADGRKIAEGSYRCDPELVPCSGHIQPKVANRDVIYLRGGGALEALKGRS